MKKILTLSSLLSLMVVNMANANTEMSTPKIHEATFAPVGFYNGSANSVNVRIGGSQYQIESGHSVSSPGVLAERVIVTSTDGSTIDVNQLRLEATGPCPQPICLTIY